MVKCLQLTNQLNHAFINLSVSAITSYEFLLPDMFQEGFGIYYLLEITLSFTKGPSKVIVHFLKTTLRKKCANTDIFLDRIRENTDQKKICVWTLFTQC